MPDLQSPMTDASAPMPIEPVLASFDQADFAFGCECADPSLHIAQWLQEASAGAADGA